MKFKLSLLALSLLAINISAHAFDKGASFDDIKQMHLKRIDERRNCVTNATDKESLRKCWKDSGKHRMRDDNQDKPDN